MAATYEQLMAKARELDAAGDTESARRLAKIALTRKGGDASQDALDSNKFAQMTEVELPDGSIVEFPADMSRDDIKAVLMPSPDGYGSITHSAILPWGS